MRRGAGASATFCGLLAAVLAWAAPASAASLPPPPDSVISGGPPVVQGTPHKIPNLPCGVLGPALDLGDMSHYVRARGTLRAAMIFVDFSDAPADADPNATPQEAFDRLVPETEARLRALSYGKLNLSVTPDLTFVRMPKPIAAYGLEGSDPQDRAHHRRFIRDAIRAADPSFDFSKYKAVYVMSGPGVEKRGGTANFAAGDGVKADGTLLAHFMTLNGFGSSISPGVLVHETGHVLGLPDLYQVLPAITNWDHFAGPWDVMSNAYENGTMLSWTRRLVGWLGDGDFRCVRAQATVNLTPVSEAGGIKGAVVRTGARRAYVVEARSAAEGPDCPDSGVLIYRINGGVKTGDGPTRVIDATPGRGDCGAHTSALFKPADAGVASYQDARIAVTVLGAARDGFRVRVRALHG